MTHPNGLTAFNITIEEAKTLARGKRRGLAGYLVRHGFHEDALPLLEHIVSEDPTGMLYRTWLVHALIGCGEIDRALELSGRLISEFPTARMVIVAREEALLTAGDHASAHALFKTHIESPENAYSYWGRVGAAAQRRGEWDEAGRALSRAHEIYSSRDQEDGEEQKVPIYLWSALAAQAEHIGEVDNPFRSELEDYRRAEEERTREELAKPDPRTSGSPRRTPAVSYQEPMGPRVVDAETAAAQAESAVDPDPNPELESHLLRLFGYEKFRKGQQRVIENVLSGNSVLTVMPTGAGKSLCYQLPAMLLDGITLVVSPLIALMKDQIDGLPSHIQRDVTLINSTLEGDEIERRLGEIRAGKYKLVYAAPERLRQRPFLHALRSRGVSLLVVDEAHCVSMWGHDFRPDYLFIGDALRYLGDPTVLAMTATATAAMRTEIANYFGRHLNVVTTGTHRPNLVLESVMVRTDEDKMRELLKLCREIDGTGIVYVRSRKKTEDLAQLLRRERIRATHYHAGMDNDFRARTHEEFMDGRWRVICATVAFGMGIDKPDVRYVIHYSLPASLEDYYQEAGRAGRDGYPSRCILLCTPSDKASVTRWMREERIEIDLPRRCYQLIRELTQDSPYAAVHIDDFERELRRDETHIRSAISMLENSGMICRRLDIPMTASVTLGANGEGDGDEEFKTFAVNARLRPGQRMPVQALELARRVSIAPDEVEEKLLNWQNSGYLTYKGSGRVMLLERLPAARDSKSTLEEMLAKHARTQEMRIEKTFRYAETHRCRHDMIAEHFGEPKVENCASCDNCVPKDRHGEVISRQAKPIESKLSNDEKKNKVVETVRMIPGRVGFTGLVKVLKGSVASYIKRDTCPNFGIFANLPKAAIEQCMTELIEEGRIRRDESEYRLLWPEE